MSLQDDIFDVEAALKGKPELDQFENIICAFGNLERELEQLQKFYFAASELNLAMKELEKQIKGKKTQ